MDQGAATGGFVGKDYTNATRFSAEWEIDDAEEPLNAYKDFLPKSKSFFHYIGSLTTFPCSNGINWFLFEEPVYITTEDLANMKSAVKNQKYTLTFDDPYHPSSNNRPLQPLGPRSVWKYEDKVFPSVNVWNDAPPTEEGSSSDEVHGGYTAAVVLAAFFGGVSIVLVAILLVPKSHIPVTDKDVELTEDVQEVGV